MAKPPIVSTTLVFGMFAGKWCWRVEWKDHQGKEWCQDFAQRDLHPGEARQQADALAADLKAGVLAA